MSTLRIGFFSLALFSSSVGSAGAVFVVENAFPGLEFDRPTQVVFLPDGRALVAEKSGFIQTVLPDGTLENYAFLNIQRLCWAIQDYGLLSIAIDPDFPTEDWVYVMYVVDPNEDNFDDAAENDKFIRVSRYRYHQVVENFADVNTREDLVGGVWSEGIPTLHTSHGAGTLRFAPDKTLIVSAGEGAHWEHIDAGGLDPAAFGPTLTDPAEDLGAFRSRSIDSLAGKVLRIDKDTGQGLPSNPHWDGDPDSDRSKVWAYGMRNPFRVDLVPGTGSTNPADGDPGVVVVGDVGWATYEWVHVVESGGYNGGWPCYEGPSADAQYQAVASTAAGNTDVLCGAPLSDENPLARSAPKAWWHHFDPDDSNPVGWLGSSITAGAFYSGTEYPVAYQGAYAVADFVGSWIRWITFDANYDIASSQLFLSDADGPVNIEAHPTTGDLYYIAYFSNEIRHIRWIDSVDVDEVAPPAERLLTSVPNPFRGHTAISFELASEEHVRVVVFDAGGRHVKTLIEGRSMGAGPHQVDWDGRTGSNDVAPPGTYFARVTIGDRTLSEKLTRIR